MKSARKKWSASPHFCINNGIIIYPQMLSVLKLSLDTLDMYVCSIFYALNRHLINNSHRKWQENEGFLVKFCWHFFLFPQVEIIRKPHPNEFCIFKNIVLSRNDFGRELCSLFFHFFIFHANLEFWPASCQWPKIKQVQTTD